MITQEVVTAIKNAVNIVDVIGQFIDLKKEGSRFVARCPFHNENTPSFKVTPSKNSFYCFGCGAKGDAIDFVEAHKNKTFQEALEYLAGLYNIDFSMFPVSSSLSVRKQETWKTSQFLGNSAPTIKPSFFPKDKFLATLKAYEKNNFVQFLIAKFGCKQATCLTEKYFIGTSRKWPGANIFWQIDGAGRVRTGKIMRYDPTTGKRDRVLKATFAHAEIKIENTQQCFFGEHLIKKQPGATVAIVESEKTAIIASIYFPKLVWVACGGKTMLTESKFPAIVSRRVVLFPDASLPDKETGKTDFQVWSDKAEEMKKAGVNVSVSDLLEMKATQEERAAGYDLADYLLKYEPADFYALIAPKQPAAPQVTPPVLVPDYSHERHTGQNKGQSNEVLLNADGYPAEWDIQPTQNESLAHSMKANPAVTELTKRFDLKFEGIEPITDESEKAWMKTKERANAIVSRAKSKGHKYKA